MLHPVIEDLSLAPEAVAISAGSFDHRGMAKSMVCTPICNPSPVYDYCTPKQMYSIPRSLPHSSGPSPPSQGPHSPTTPGPDYPAPDLTATSLNSHSIYIGPQLLIEEPPEAYKSIQAVVDGVEEEQNAEGVSVLRLFVT